MSDAIEACDDISRLLGLDSPYQDGAAPDMSKNGCRIPTGAEMISMTQEIPKSKRKHWTCDAHDTFSKYHRQLSNPHKPPRMKFLIIVNKKSNVKLDSVTSFASCSYRMMIPAQFGFDSKIQLNIPRKDL